MRIALLIQDCTTVGGTERVTCCLANEMARQGQDVSVISVFGVGGECKFSLDERVRFVVACDENYGLELSKFQRLCSVFKMARRLKHHELLLEADVVVAQKFFAAMMAVVAGFRDKLIIGDHYPYRLYSQPLLKVRDIIYRKARRVVVLTEGCKRDFVRNGVTRVDVIGNMLPIPENQSVGIREKVILAVGRLSEEKGFDSLIRAVALVNNDLEGWRVEICGEGEQRPRLEALIREFGLEDKVVLRGNINNVSDEYARASFGVVPSRYEGFSLVLLEAAAMSLPMVAFDCPYGPGEILSQGGGVLVKDQDIDELGKALVQMADDEKLRQKYACETRIIVERFSPSKIYNQWMQTIAKCR